MKISLSIVIITYNEEQNIDRCISSVLPIADDIVVVDSYSNDKTVEIASNLGARIVMNKFEGHIQQKNFAITHAKYPYILSLDADEQIDKALEKEILILKSNWTVDGYEMNRLNNYCGQWIKHGAWYPDIKLRLWDSRKGFWNGLNPHDKFEMHNNSAIKHLKGNIRHYSYKTIAEHKNKIEYFSSISAASYFDKGVKSSIIKMIFSPIVRFIRDYIFKLGFLDGYNGIVISILSSKEVYLKYKKLKVLNNTN